MSNCRLSYKDQSSNSIRPISEFLTSDISITLTLSLFVNSVRNTYSDNTTNQIQDSQLTCRHISNSDVFLLRPILMNTGLKVRIWTGNVTKHRLNKLPLIYWLYFLSTHSIMNLINKLLNFGVSQTILHNSVFLETQSYTTHKLYRLPGTSVGLHSSHRQTCLLSRTVQYYLFLLLRQKCHSFTAYAMRRADNKSYNTRV